MSAHGPLHREGGVRPGDLDTVLTQGENTWRREGPGCSASVGEVAVGKWAGMHSNKRPLGEKSCLQSSSLISGKGEDTFTNGNVFTDGNFLQKRKVYILLSGRKCKGRELLLCLLLP